MAQGSVSEVTRVPRPQVVWVRRRNSGKTTPGDIACVRLEPGLIALLQPTLDSGYQAPWSIPVGLAITAALAVLTPVSRSIDWQGRDLDIQWSGPAAAGDTLLVEARLEQLSERKSCFAICARTETGSPLCSGTLRLIATQNGRPVGFRSQQEYDAARASIMAAAIEPILATGSSLRTVAAPRSIPLGCSTLVEVEFRNATNHPVSVAVEGHLPFGAGLSFDGPRMHNLHVEAGASCRAGFTVRADRPHEVNLGQPWSLEISAGNETLKLQLAVPDPNPGRTFYLLTEDCETFDGGPLTGNYAGMETLGNHNNFMDIDDYRVQMILKPNRMNQIAERHGAHWTHFYAITQRFAVDWAAAQSKTGEWPRIAAEMDFSIRAGSLEHEYCPHIHYDYEPDSILAPQPRLVYDAATDGLLPNDYWDPVTNPTHRYHDWDGAARGHSYIKPLGDWDSLDTKTGSLRKCIRYLARLAANRRSVVVARTGSYDFGVAPEDQAISTRAYEANGLLGNSDAYFSGSPPRAGGRMFWCSDQDRTKLIGSLDEAGLVQLGIGMESGFGSAEEMNGWFAAERESCRGPGVHATVFTCHAMFFNGQPHRFRSLNGGAFLQLDRHLDWVRANYPDVEFATAGDAVLEFLDYYTPTLEAHTMAHVCDGDPQAGRYEFAVRLLGRGIRVDEDYPGNVRITAPPCFSPAELAELRIRQGDTIIASSQSFLAGVQPSLTAVLTGREPLVLELQLRPEVIEQALTWFRDNEGVVFHDLPEAPGPDLLHVYSPTPENDEIRFSGDVVRLLMNPVAGHPEPLGRRTHPLTCYAVGAALTAAFKASAANVPVRLKLRLLHALNTEQGFVAKARVSDGVVIVQIREDSGTDLASGEVVVT